MANHLDKYDNAPWTSIEESDTVEVPIDVLDRLVGLAETVEDTSSNERQSVEWGQQRIWQSVIEKRLEKKG